MSKTASRTWELILSNIFVHIENILIFSTCLSWFVFFSWDRVGLITSTQGLYSQAALPTKQLMEQQGKHVIFRALEPIVSGTQVRFNLLFEKIFRKYLQSMMMSSNGNIFHVTGPLCGEFTGHRLIPYRDQRRGALMFYLIRALTNGGVNNRDACDLRRHCTHYRDYKSGRHILWHCINSLWCRWHAT